jgi:bacterial/archaeal transporter family-2 protein
MMGILFSIIAGVAMSLQGVFNTRLGEKIGSWESNVFVQGTGLLVALIVLMFAGNGGLKHIKEANKLYLLGGVLGVIIIFTVMQGIKSLGPTCSIAIILIAQLTAAALIDAFGLFDSAQIKFGLTKIIGIVIMVTGIIIFKWKC